MKFTCMIITFSILFLGCSKGLLKPTKIDDEAKILFTKLPQTHLLPGSFNELPNWEKENHNEALQNFLNSCSTQNTREIYNDICTDANTTQNAKLFIESNFTLYRIVNDDMNSTGLLTGYYEPTLSGSLQKSAKYKYPIYETPKDLIIVDLSAIYPDLKHYRLRGKLDGNKLVPYHTREQSSSAHIPADIICYTDSKIDLFFLEIQGSGRVELDNGDTLFLGYDNQNGHKYSAIGRYLVEIGALETEEVSLQSIRSWLDANPSRVDEVLNYNDSVVYFKQRQNPASGSLGICLTAKRSIAVDRRYIPLGSALYLNAQIDDVNTSRFVLAQDTGGAIKGAVRADIFLGCGKEARESAGKLKSELDLWILLPKDMKE